MRFKAGSRSSEQDEALQTNTADYVLQVGNMKVPIKAEKLLGGSVRVSSKANIPLKAEKLLGPPTLNEEEKAVEAFSRMREVFTTPAQDQSTGSWAPFSPDDFYFQNDQSAAHPHTTARHPSSAMHREPYDANLPGYYDLEAQPQHHHHHHHHHRQQQQHQPRHRTSIPTPASASAPTIFDNLSNPYPPNQDSTRSIGNPVESPQRTKAGKRSSTKPRKLDLVQLLPNQKASTGRILSPARLSSSPCSSLNERTEAPLPPLPSSGPEPSSRRARAVRNVMARSSTSSGGKKKVSDEPILDEFKTNRRRPPKGIQNWFDAFDESDEDDEDDEEDDDDDDDDEGFQEVSFPGAPPPPPPSEPQELPADELPPAYTAPSRPISRASDKSGSQRGSVEPTLDNRHAFQHGTTQEELDRYRAGNDSHSWDSIQSSHIGYLPPDTSNEQLVASSGAGRSVLSLSEFEYPEGLESNIHLPNGLGDQRVTTLASVSALDLHQLPRGSQTSLHSGRQATRTDADSPVNGGELALHDGGANATDGTAHFMAVTEEEKMILDLMRRKKTVMFSEGYQMALQTEQQRIVQQGTPAERDALRTLQQAQVARRDSEMSSIPSPADTEDMRRQLSAICKENVDGRFQLERFLGAVESRPSDAYPPDGPIALPTHRLSGELLPSTVYSPTGTPLMRSPAFNQDAFRSPEEQVDPEDVKRRVEQFIATNGAVPPLNTHIKLMQRQAKTRRGSSMPPSPVIEEERQSPLPPPAPPAIPERSPGRGAHSRGVSDVTGQISSVSLNEEVQSDSPVSALPSTVEAGPQARRHPPPSLTTGTRREGATSASHAVNSPFSSLIQAASHPKAGTSEGSEDGASARPAPLQPSSHRKLPSPVSRYNHFGSEAAAAAAADGSMISISSVGEDVLAAWHHLGGATEGLNMKRKGRAQASGP